MAKLSSVNKNNRRIKLSKKYLTKRNKLKKIIMDKKISLEERLRHNKNYQVTRNSSKTRVINRCQITEPHVYRKLKISKRSKKVDFGKIPGMVKSSW